ncbi:MAG: hypothetical protein WCL14_12115, partial [Bacteroidota bacterium]
LPFRRSHISHTNLFKQGKQKIYPVLNPDIKKGQDAASSRLYAASSRQDAVSSRQDAVSSRQDATSSRLYATSSRQDAASSRQDAVSSRLYATSSRQDAVSSRQDATSSRLEDTAFSPRVSPPRLFTPPKGTFPVLNSSETQKMENLKFKDIWD